MRLDAFVVLASMILLVDLASAEPRDQEARDTARRAEQVERPVPGFQAAPDRGAAAVERVNPAVSQFWSDPCVRQRRFGMPHTADCDNPAYSGGRYGNVRPHQGYAPYGRYGRPSYEPRGGAVIIERDYRRFDRFPSPPGHPPRNRWGGPGPR